MDWWSSLASMPATRLSGQWVAVTPARPYYRNTPNKFSTVSFLYTLNRHGLFLLRLIA